MSDPPRLVDGGVGFETSLLRAAKKYRVSPDTRRRAYEAAGLVAGAPFAAPAAARAGALGAKIKVLALVGVAVVAGLSARQVLVRRASAPPKVTASAVPPPPSAVETSAAGGVPLAAPPAPVPVVAPPHARRSVAAPDRDGDDLRAELAALDAASRALARGDATNALSLLAAYGRAFPSGSLGLEAKVLEAECLERAGRHEDAVRSADAFLAKHPTSPLSSRMRRLTGR